MESRVGSKKEVGHSKG